MRRMGHFFTSSIQRRMLSSFAIVIVLVFAMAVIGLIQLKQIETYSEQVVPNSLQMELLQDFALSLSSLNTNIDRYLIIGGLEFEENIYRDIENAREILVALKENADPKAGLVLDEMGQVITGLETEIMALVYSPPTTSRQMNEQIILIISEIENAERLQQELTTITLEQLHTTVQEQKKIISDVSGQFLIMSGLASVVVVIASLWVTRSIATPLIRLSQGAAKIAEGDLSVRVPVNTRDETGQLAAAFNNMATQLHSLINDLEQEIAERRRVEQRLRIEKEFTDTALDAQMDTFFLFDPVSGKALRWNRAFREISEYSNDEIASLPAPTTYYTPDDLERAEIFIQNVLVEGAGTIELELVSKAGRKIPTEYRVSVIRDTKGNPQYIISIGRDITVRKQAEQALKNYAHQLETLNKVTAVLTSSLALDGVLKLILEHIQAVVPVDSAAVFLKDKDQLQVVMDWGIHPSVVGRVTLDDNPLFGNMTENWEPLILNNPLDDSRFENWASSQELQSWMGVPLLVRGEIIGYLTLDSNQAEAFQPELIPLVKSFAAQASQALDNARQFSTAKQRLDRLTSLHQIDQAISSSLDLRVTLNILLEQVLLQLEVDSAAILLFQPELQSLEYVAGRGFRTQAFQTTSLHLGEGFAGRAALERRIVKLSDPNEIKSTKSYSQKFRREAFVAYIGVPLIAKGNITGVLEIFHRKSLQPDPEWMDFLATLAGQAAIAIDNINLFGDLQKSNMELIQAYDATIEGWARALEMRDMETEGHSRRVVDITLELADRLGIRKENLIHVRRGALLHDIGKMGIPDVILQKTGKFTPEEWEIMRQHPIYAYQMLVSIPYLRRALDIPYCHHEKWDGSGYPRGLEGEQIPLAARIFAVVDVWDALNSDRPYRKAWPLDEVMSYIQDQSGKHFDPQVVAAFFELLAKNGHFARPS